MSSTQDARSRNGNIRAMTSRGMAQGAKTLKSPETITPNTASKIRAKMRVTWEGVVNKDFTERGSPNKGVVGISTARFYSSFLKTYKRFDKNL